MTKLLRLLSVAALLLVVSLVSAQDAENIEYGDVAEGEMTEDEFEFNYTFEGTEGDVVIVSFRPVEEFGDLGSPIIIVTDEDGDTVADTTDAFVFGNLIVAAELENDGEYNIFLTRADGRSGDSVGEFTLELINLPILEVGSPLEAEETDSDSRSQYYAVKSDENWGLSYLKLDGSMEVEVAVNTIDTTSASLIEVASVDGDMMNEAAIGIFEGGDTYVVSIGEPLFAFNFDTVDAEYSLELLTFE
ncbi:MAG: hypothetical protein H7X77_03370 [Anaerolineae bacterium]|nr:hypothetical protein [Anaerolineae bacterium]